jgi:glycolate oxidase
MHTSIVEKLEEIVGEANVTVERERMLNYLADESPTSIRPSPADDLVLVKPADTRQVARVLQFANAQRLAVFPRGGGTGLAGGAVPTRNGIILSLERLRRIEIDQENLMAVAEAGVTLGELADEAEKVNLAFSPHPGDETAQVGGLVATNAGGSRAVKHGVMRNQVRGIEAVLPTGDVLTLGGKVHKNNVGYDLMQLIIGSEGTLAVITKATIQLSPTPGATLTLIQPFHVRRDALSSVPRILKEAETPLAIEYVERNEIERSAKRLGTSWPVKEGKCFLIIILAEATRDQVLSQSIKIAEICRRSTAFETYVAESKPDQENILNIRSQIYFALKSELVDILDITVPIAQLEPVMEAIGRVAIEYNAHLPIYGHAGDGNLHVHIIRKDGEEADHVEELRSEIYGIATSAGGVISGEHGVGKIRTGKLITLLGQKEIELLEGVKRVFDPNWILNPGTTIPTQQYFLDQAK